MYYSEEQRQEDLYGGCDYQNELQLSHAIERMETTWKRADQKRIAELTKNGFWVVVEKWIVYGKITDAFLGHNSDITMVTRSGEEAEAFVIEANEVGFGENEATLFYPEPPNERG